MATFQAKTSWERLRKSENKNYRFDQFLPDLLQGLPKKQQKNSKNKKKIIIASFQAKTSWERSIKSENYRSDQFLPNPEQRIPKKQQKSSKNKKT